MMHCYLACCLADAAQCCDLALSAAAAGTYVTLYAMKRICCLDVEHTVPVEFRLQLCLNTADAGSFRPDVFLKVCLLGVLLAQLWGGQERFQGIF